ncbi:hypothetical protein EHP00_2484 [Ecytonucleospora hepatopenaei]|uniref:Uncharacterized protein n=1 Tax=Ecytonucleospora hepatopenaei TaxID=646526 RepID=A0A1W0E2R8_9MICR|nr:hypothetical protein EHP00_2484 [Ecytonucleospora hepatopenaei]
MFCFYILNSILCINNINNEINNEILNSSNKIKICKNQLITCYTFVSRNKSFYLLNGLKATLSHKDKITYKDARKNTLNYFYMLTIFLLNKDSKIILNKDSKIILNKDSKIILNKEHKILNLKNSNRLLLKEITSYEDIANITNNKDEIYDIYESIKLRVLGIKEGKNDELYDLTDNIKYNNITDYNIKYNDYNIKYNNTNYNNNNIYYDINILNNNKHFTIKIENIEKLRKFEIFKYILNNKNKEIKYNILYQTIVNNKYNNSILFSKCAFYRKEELEEFLSDTEQKTICFTFEFININEIECIDIFKQLDYITKYTKEENINNSDNTTNTDICNNTNNNKLNIKNIIFIIICIILSICIIFYIIYNYNKKEKKYQ